MQFPGREVHAVSELALKEKTEEKLEHFVDAKKAGAENCSKQPDLGVRRRCIGTLPPFPRKNSTAPCTYDIEQRDAERYPQPSINEDEQQGK